jgi:DNA-binding transcriptional regulator GbsR (MarR family)
MLKQADSMQQAMWEMIEAGGRTAETFGVSRLLGQIYTLLYLRNEPLSLDDIATELAVSKASVSIACRQLATFGALHRSTRRGDRRDFYEAVQDFRGLLQNGLLPILEKKLESARIQIDKCRRMLAEGNDGPSHRLLERLDEAETRRKKISDLIGNPLVRRLL